MRFATIRQRFSAEAVSFSEKPPSHLAVAISLVTGLGFSALLLGMFVAIFPWWLSLALVILPGILILTLSLPYQGLLLSVLLVFDAIPHRLFPKIPIGAGGIKIYDLLILLLLASVLVRGLLNGVSIKARLGPLFLPLAYVVACVLISVVYVQVFARNPFVLSEARQHIAWMLLPIAALSIDTQSKYQWFIRSLLLVGVTVASIVIFQSLTGINLLGGRVEELDRFNSDINRSTAGGAVYIIVFSLYFLLGAAVGRRLSWWITIPLMVVLAGGLLVTFGRGVWVGAAVGLVVTTYLYRGAAAAALAPIAAALLIVASVSIVSLGNPRMGEAIVDRALGISREVETGASYYHRKNEVIEAIRVITNRPLMGVGLGGDYKATITSSTFDGETRYIHNSYLLLPLKMGLHAALIPVLFVLAALTLVRRSISLASHKSRHVPAAAAGAFLVPIITSITQPEWGTVGGIAAMCSLLTVLLLYTRFEERATSNKPTMKEMQRFASLTY